MDRRHRGRTVQFSLCPKEHQMVSEAAAVWGVSVASFAGSLVLGAVMKGGGTVDGLMAIAQRAGYRAKRAPNSILEDQWISGEVAGRLSRGPWRMTRANPSSHSRNIPENQWKLTHVDRPGWSHPCGYTRDEALAEAQAIIAND